MTNVELAHMLTDLAQVAVYSKEPHIQQQALTVFDALAKHAQEIEDEYNKLDIKLTDEQEKAMKHSTFWIIGEPHDKTI